MNKIFVETRVVYVIRLLSMNATVASPTTIEFTPAGGSSFVYFTIEDSSSTAARTTVTSMFECRIGDPIGE